MSTKSHIQDALPCHQMVPVSRTHHEIKDVNYRFPLDAAFIIKPFLGMFLGYFI